LSFSLSVGVIYLFGKMIIIVPFSRKHKIKKKRRKEDENKELLWQGTQSTVLQQEAMGGKPNNGNKLN